MSPKKKRGLSAEEQQLWSQVTQTAIPLSPKPATQVAPPLGKPAKPMPTMQPIAPFTVGQTAKKPQTSTQLAPSIRDQLHNAPVQMDKKSYRRMSRGKLTPEARIDLHGMTLNRAHPALIGFIMSSHSAGKRLVLVITGKGRDGDDSGPVPERRGILRRQVPLWLGQAPLAPLILQVSQASATHGGSGAYYVYLRRAR